jgi:hypothetical protein
VKPGNVVAILAVGALVGACGRLGYDPLDLEPRLAATGGGQASSAGGGPIVGIGGAFATGGAATGGMATGGSGGGGDLATTGVGGGIAGSSGSGGAFAGGGGTGGAGVDASAGNAGAGGRGGTTNDASVADAVDATAAGDVRSDVTCPGAGTAVSLDRTRNQYVVIPGNALPSGASPRTVEMWVLNPSPIANWSGNHTLFELGQAGALGTFAMDFDTPYRMELYANPPANSYYFSTGVVQDTWFHLAATYDGTKNHAFVNGVEMGAGFTLSGPLATPANQALFLGSNGVTDNCTASIDELRVWNFARTQAEIARDMSYRLTGTEPGLVGYYRFDEVFGTIVFDATPRANHGTIMNGATYGPSGAPIGCR